MPASPSLPPHAAPRAQDNAHYAKGYERGVWNRNFLCASHAGSITPARSHPQKPYGDVVGMATFRETVQRNVSIEIAMTWFLPGGHAVIIHQNPVCDSPDFRSAGGHFNPDSRQHGLENPLGHHAGDLPGNLIGNEKEPPKAHFTVSYLSLRPNDPRSVLGHSIIIHDKPDDLKTDPTGGSGNRVACGVIAFHEPLETPGHRSPMKQ